MYDSSNRKDIRRAEKAQRQADRDARDVIVNLCSSAPGRAWVWDRLASSGVFQTSFSPDPYTMAFNEGNRNQGLQLLAQITAHCPEQFVQAMREYNDRSNANVADRDPRRNDADGDEPGGFGADYPDGTTGL